MIRAYQLNEAHHYSPLHVTPHPQCCCGVYLTATSWTADNLELASTRTNQSWRVIGCVHGATDVGRNRKWGHGGKCSISSPWINTTLLTRGWLIFGANTTLIIHGYREYHFQLFPTINTMGTCRYRWIFYGTEVDLKHSTWHRSGPHIILDHCILTEQGNFPSSAGKPTRLLLLGTAQKLASY